MADTGHASMHFSQECYPSYTSIEPVSSYRTSGYLSPPYSISRRSTTETAFTSSSRGLGIEPYHSYTSQHEQPFYMSSTKSSNYPDDSQHQIRAVQSMPSPCRRDKSPTYITNSGTLPSRVTTDNRHQSIYESPPSLVTSSHGNYYHHVGYDDQAALRDMHEGSDPSHFGYQPDPMQEGKWVATSHGMLTMSEPPTQTVAWHSDYSQSYSYDVRYSSLGGCNPRQQSPATGNLYGLQESHIVAMSTPPASHEGSPAQDISVGYNVNPVPSGRGNDNETPYGTPSPVDTAEDSGSAQITTKIPSRNGKRLLGRLPKSVAPRPTLQCRLCPKMFSKQSKLRDHEISHEKSTAICPEPHCKKIYGRQADLARHQRSHHKGHLFPCKYCAKNFNRSDITRRHEEHSCRQRRAERATLGTPRNSIRTR